MKTYEIKKVKMYEHLIETENQVVTHLDLDKGKEMPEHKSDFTAIVVPIKGRVEFTASGERTEIYPGKIVRMEAGEFHFLKALEDSDLIVIKSDLR